MKTHFIPIIDYNYNKNNENQFIRKRHFIQQQWTNKHKRDKLNKPVPAWVSPSLHTQEADMESNETSLQSVKNNNSNNRLQLHYEITPKPGKFPKSNERI